MRKAQALDEVVELELVHVREDAVVLGGGGPFGQCFGRQHPQARPPVGHAGKAELAVEHGVDGQVALVHRLAEVIHLVIVGASTPRVRAAIGARRIELAAAAPHKCERVVGTGRLVVLVPPAPHQKARGFPPGHRSRRTPPTRRCRRPTRAASGRRHRAPARDRRGTRLPGHSWDPSSTSWRP